VFAVSPSHCFIRETESIRFEKDRFFRNIFVSSITEIPTNNPRRIAAILLVVFLSIVLPVGASYFWIKPFLTGKPWGFRSNEYKGYDRTIKNGEMWFASVELSASFLAKERTQTSKFAPSHEYKIKRLDLTTGVETDTGLVPYGPMCSQLWMNNELYLNTGNGVYKADASSLKKIAESPLPMAALLSAPMHSRVFVYDNQITTVVDADNGAFRLIHLVNGNWVEGRRVRFPRRDRVWDYDDQRERVTLLPISSKQPSLPARRVMHNMKPVLQVIQHEQQTHLLFSVYPDFSAYRNGFEFVDGDETVASALSPENSIHEVSGWEPIESVQNDEEIFDQIACDRDGPLFLGWGMSCRCVRRRPDGTWAKITIPSGGYYGQLRADPSEPNAYIVGIDGSYDVSWGRAKVHRIQGNEVHPPHLKLPGFMGEYLARWQRLRGGLFITWIMHLGIVFAGTAWFTGRTSRTDYLFGFQRAALASIWRRAFAMVVDILIVSATATLFLWAGVNWVKADVEKQCSALFEFESHPEKLLITSVFSFLPEPTDKGTFLLVVIASASLLLTLRTILEGRFGMTPGKWLFGIRTVRTTLRRCGITRSLLRGLLYWFDLLNLITPLPAAVSIMLSPQRQRLGDRVADTIVVCANSIRDDDCRLRSGYAEV
jgi:uncharacterized RDD family membrane protein YckC